MPSVPFTVFGPQKGLFVSFLDRSEALTYTAAYRGTLALPDGPVDPVRVLERIFAEGNGMGDGEGFTVGRRSMSVGDVVTLEGLGTWICDSIGWREITGAEAARFPLHGAEVCPPFVVTEETLLTDYVPAHPLPNGLAVYVHRDQLGGDTPAEVVVAGWCRVTGEFYALTNVPLLGLSNWYDLGMAIQDALPTLSPADREFIKSGIHPRVLNPET
ncbi:MAG TPA: hypothetical protein VF746_14730 [Longimicrobium sp.]|jgi:hypothetical protein